MQDFIQHMIYVDVHVYTLKIIGIRYQIFGQNALSVPTVLITSRHSQVTFLYKMLCLKC